MEDCFSCQGTEPTIQPQPTPTPIPSVPSPFELAPTGTPEPTKPFNWLPLALIAAFAAAIGYITLRRGRKK